MLINEASRRDGTNPEFIEAVTNTLGVLETVFDRSPKYAWIAKQLLEPERSIHFRVAWIDDLGVTRMNRGYRIQYSSALGPYEGALHFSGEVNSSILKSFGFDAVIRNSLTGFGQGASVGGADFNPSNKSEAEIQRFCQSYMTELSKYIGPDQDIPYMGTGVGSSEVGYLYGQYKRINVKTGSGGRPFLWGGTPSCPKATGFGVRLIPNPFTLPSAPP
jgi:glutamate dehydrogenase (NADP+)